MSTSLPWLGEGEEYRGYLFGVRKEIVSVPGLIHGPRLATPEELAEQKSKTFIESAYQVWKGGKKVVTGVGILAVPDPIPLIDEIYAVALITTGTHEIATAF